ncbi:MAG TPA: hypothetical protein PKH07_01110 [bacterium]|nr:hypothetical protein [bacterium]
MRICLSVVTLSLLLQCVAFSDSNSSWNDQQWRAFCKENRLRPEGWQSAKPAKGFPIGIWFDGRVHGINVPEGSVNVPAGEAAARTYYREHFTRIKNRGIPIIVIPNTPPEYRPWLLDEAQKVGVRIVLEIVEFVDLMHDSSCAADDWDKMLSVVRDVHKQIGGYRSLLYYQLIDEPVAALSAKLQALTRILGGVDPRRAAFSCLCGIGDKEQLIKEWNPSMVVYDCYPLRKDSPVGDFGGFCPSVDTAFRFADGRPLWMVVQTCAHTEGGLRIPTPAEIRAMTYLSLAHGAKGLFFFLYNSNTQTERLIGLDVLPEHFAEVADLTAKMKSLSRQLPNLTRIGLIQSKPTTLDVQEFRDVSGRGFLFVVNTDVQQVFNGNMTIEVTSSEWGRLEDCLTRERYEMAEKGFRLTLLPGEGKLLRCR